MIDLQAWLAEARGARAEDEFAGARLRAFIDEHGLMNLDVEQRSTLIRLAEDRIVAWERYRTFAWEAR